MISVCIPTFNGSKYITAQIQSILNQLSEDDEIIISDDNSSDDTIALLKAFADKRIKIYAHSSVKSKWIGALKGVYLINRNLENALLKASGDIIFIADQDDVWLENKIERVVSELSDADLILHNCKVVNSDLKILEESFFNIAPPHVSFFRTFFHTPFMGCCMAFNRKIKDCSLPFPDYAVEHDTWLGFCGMRFGKIKVLDEPLILYRRHSNNVSPCFDGSTNNIYIRFKRRILMLKAYCFLLLK